jgi:hypothetical protein
MSGINVPPQACPACGYVVDAASDAFGDSLPAPGDVCVCLACAAVGIYGAGLMIRLPDAGEAADVASNRDIARVQKAIRASWRVMSRPGGKGCH